MDFNNNDKPTRSTSSDDDAGDIKLSCSPHTQSLLLTSATIASSPNRKSRSAEIGSSRTFAERPSLSPAPQASWRLSLQQAARRPSQASEASLSRLNSQRRPSADRKDPVTVPTEDFGPVDRSVEAENPSGTARISRRPSVIENSLAFIQAQTSALERERDRHRNSISSSIYSLGSSIINSAWPPPRSTASSVADSDIGDYQGDGQPNRFTTAVSPISITTTGHSNSSSASNSEKRMPSEGAAPIPSIASQMGPPSQPIPPRTESRQSRTRVPSSRQLSGINTNGTSSPSDRSMQNGGEGSLGIIGVCALDAKARAKPSRNILNRLNANNEFEVILFGDKVILDEEPENWPLCDYFISFFSDGFPLDKAIEYVRIRKPFSINDLPMQMVLWDRRLCLQILDRYQVPTPARVEVSRDGGPRIVTPELAQHISKRTGIRLAGPENGIGGGQAPPKEVIMVDDDTIRVDGVELKKPFVEKPVSGEDHNVYIYYSSAVGGGGRRLFRKINNKSSEADETLNIPRSITDPTSSYLYEQFLSTQNHEDVKAYTVGKDYCHAETRKSPVVDGIVKRNTHGKEIRYVTPLTADEVTMASKISEAFGQWVCGFDLLRNGNKSFVIDVNGWSFVKDNSEYYDRCATLLRKLFIEEILRKEGRAAASDTESIQDGELLNKHGALSSLKSLLKSPSLSRLQPAQQQGRRISGATSPDLGQGSLPLSTSPSMERVISPRSPLMAQPDVIPSSIGSVIQDDATTADSTPQGSTYVPPPASKAQWRLKGMVAVIRHADRTPKQKFKFTFHSKPFVDLLKGHREEVLLMGEAALGSVLEAVSIAQADSLEDAEKLKLLRMCLVRKGEWPGTKVQIKPMFKKKAAQPTTDTVESGGNSAPTTDSLSVPNEGQVVRSGDGARPHLHKDRHNSTSDDVTLSRAAAKDENLGIEKLQLIIKWGGEPTHSARYQSQELGEIMRNDLLLMNRDSVENLKVFSSSERRSTTSAQIWTASFLSQQDVPADFVQVRKDLLDDSNAAKDEMDKVKKKLKGLLREGNKAPPQFTWPESMPEPFIVARNVVDLMKFHRRVMYDNFARLYAGIATSTTGSAKQTASATAAAVAEAVASIQPRWCSQEDAELFKERWEKLFTEFQDPEKVDPGRISELHDTIKFDALHNRPFLEWVFTPSQALMDEFYPTESSGKATPDTQEDGLLKPPTRTDTSTSRSPTATEKPADRGNLAQRMGFKRRPVVDPNELRRTASNSATESYFSLFTGDSHSRAKADVRLEKLRELFLHSKILFDFIGPQEYGITNAEKLEIGLLTSLPLLKAIVHDLEDMQASPGAKTRVYFTKESHIYTLLNCILEGGIKTKIARNKIPELDYLSTICFELYESQNNTTEDEEESFNYSIRITISPGCHTFEPLDVQLDSKHCIGFAQRRSLTPHIDWQAVISTLRAKFHTVKLPKSFIAVNLSEKVPQAFEKTHGELTREVSIVEGLLRAADGSVQEEGLGEQKRVLEGRWDGRVDVGGVVSGDGRDGDGKVEVVEQGLQGLGIMQEQQDGVGR